MQLRRARFNCKIMIVDSISRLDKKSTCINSKEIYRKKEVIMHAKGNPFFSIKQRSPNFRCGIGQELFHPFIKSIWFRYDFIHRFKLIPIQSNKNLRPRLKNNDYSRFFVQKIEDHNVSGKINGESKERNNGCVTLTSIRTRFKSYCNPIY